MSDTMKDAKRELGKIKLVQLGIEDHGILTLELYLDFGGRGQGFGGICLGSSRGSAIGTDYLIQILNLFGSPRDYHDIKGRHVYALRDEAFGQIKGIEIPECDGGGIFLVDEWRKAALEKYPHEAKDAKR